MRIIADIAKDMMEEIHDAKRRIKRAAEIKPLHPEIAQREYEIAMQELAHADKDHASAVELIAVYKKEKGEPPAVMLAIWQDKHDHYLEKYSKVKNMIEAYSKA